MWPAVKAMLHSVYDQPDAEAVNAQFDRLLDYVEEKLPDAFEHLDAARADILAFTGFPTGSGSRSGPIPLRQAGRESFMISEGVGGYVDQSGVLDGADP